MFWFRLVKSLKNLLVEETVTQILGKGFEHLRYKNTHKKS